MERNNQQGIDIEDLTRILEELKLTQTRTNQLILELEESISKGRKTKKRITEVNLTLEQYRDCIGQRVRILNPASGEPNVGTITAVGKLYITVKLSSTLSRNRIAKNIRLIQHE